MIKELYSGKSGLSVYLSVPMSVGQGAVDIMSRKIHKSHKEGITVFAWQRGTAYTDDVYNTLLNAMNGVVVMLPNNAFEISKSMMTSGSRKETIRASNHGVPLYIGYFKGGQFGFDMANIYTATLEEGDRFAAHQGTAKDFAERLEEYTPMGTPARVPEQSKRIKGGTSWIEEVEKQYQLDMLSGSKGSVIHTNPNALPKSSNWHQTMEKMMKDHGMMMMTEERQPTFEYPSRGFYPGIMEATEIGEAYDKYLFGIDHLSTLRGYDKRLLLTL
jgi:hypothetical protein